MRTLIPLVTVLVVAGPVAAQTSFPMITHATPVAVQRGKTAEIAVEGQQNFHGTYKVLFEGGGLSAVVGEYVPGKPAADKKPQARGVKLKVTVAPDAALGVREFRVASTLGVSSVGHLLVVDDPVVPETSANNTREQAQALTLPCVVAGKIEAVEDVDYFKFEAEAGQTLTFEVQCARLQDRIHDLQKHAKPMLTLFDAEGRELVANDHFYFADPLLIYKVAKTGTYYLQIRDSTYDGDARWVYALIATTKAYASHVYPMAGKAGDVIDVEPVGFAKSVRLTVPGGLGLHQLPLDLGGVRTNPVAFLSSGLAQTLEVEPNDTPGQATRCVVPCGINGRIGQKRDLDHFVFKAEKGKAVRFELKARRFNTLLCSALHGVLEVMTPKGVVIVGNDDTHGKEAALVFTPPADGDFVLRVRDLNSKGGPAAVYFVEAEFARPDFQLRCDPDKAMIGPGSSTAWYVHVVRQHGFAGPVKVEVKGLPAGVTATPLTIDPAMNQGLIVLTAAADAKVDAALVELVGTAQAKHPEGVVTLVRPVQSNQEIYSPGGGRARIDVNTHAVAVTEKSDIHKVEVNAKEIVLKPGQEVKIEVTLERRADYDKSVTLDILLQHLGTVVGNPLPPGVTVVTGKSKTLLGGASKGHIVIKCAPNAEPVENVPVSVLAHVSINFVVKVSYSSLPIMVSVRK